MGGWFKESRDTGKRVEPEPAKEYPKAGSWGAGVDWRDFTPQKNPFGALLTGPFAPFMGLAGAVVPEEGKEAPSTEPPTQDVPVPAETTPAPVDPFGGRDPMTPVVTGYSGGDRSLQAMVPAMRQIHERRVKALESSTQAQAQAQRTKAFQTQLLESDLAFRREKQQEGRTKRQAKLDVMEGEAAELRAQVAAEKIDPNRWFSSRNAGQVVATSLAAMLQGFVMGYRGQTGPNPVLQRMERAIERDIATQRANIAKKRGDLAGVKGAMADFMKRGLNEDQAEAQTVKGLVDQYKLKIDAATAASQSPVIEARGVEAKANLDQMQLNFEAKAKAAAVVRKKTEPLYKVMAKRRKAVEEVQGKPTKLPKEDDTRIQGAIESLDREDRYVKDLLKYRKGATFGAAQGLVTGKVPLVGTEAKRIEGLRNQLVGMQTKAISGGAATDVEFERNMPKSPSMTDSVEQIRRKQVASLQETRSSMEALIRRNPRAEKARLAVQVIKRIDKRIARVKRLQGQGK